MNPEPDAHLESEPDAPVSKRRIVAGGAAIVLLLVAYWLLSDAGILPNIGNERALRAEVLEWGPWGPLLLILLMTGAIVLSPIPSGPIAVVAGAVYGPVLGTTYTVAGAVLGAVIAFWIGRCVGYESLRSWPAARNLLRKLRNKRSQGRLMAIVFLSRLVPFISFDAVSYVAGLTPLAFWRFTVATFAGVVPVSFALAYFGDRIVAAGSERIMLFVVLAGGVTLVPIAVKMVLNRVKSQREDGSVGR